MIIISYCLSSSLVGLCVRFFEVVKSLSDLLRLVVFHFASSEADEFCVYLSDCLQDVLAEI